MVLQLPDFDKPFIIDCDVSGSGFGAVLHQGAGPLAFFSRTIAPHHAKLAAYERELIGLVKAVRRSWCAPTTSASNTSWISGYRQSRNTPG
jgi:hypothetical protein